MNLEETVYSLLSAALPAYGSPVEELVPADRIKPLGDWQDMDRPYIVHFPVVMTPLYTHDGIVPLAQWPTHQVSIFADDYSTARKVADAAVATLTGTHDAFHFFLRNQLALYEDETKLCHIVLEWEAWGSRI